MSKRLRVALLLLLMTTVAACNRLDLGYRNLDWLIPWALGDYLSLDGEQKSWFKPRLREHLKWHCTTQLPAYSAWLQRTRELVDKPSVTMGDFNAQFDDFRHAIDALAMQVTPTTVELLRGLSDKQVDELQGRFGEERQKMHKEYLELALDKQVDERSERMEERLKPWFGKLSAGQRQRIGQWSASLGEQNQAWLDNRIVWQRQLISALRERNQDSFPSRIAQLLQKRHELWTPAYRQQFERSEQALAELFADLFNSADTRQREHLKKSLGDLRDNLANLSCPKD
ncbi:DUF6279 family lipoprotein [Pseudomonas sp. LRF_L74]|uniref:DUF6279 family lipoprotein n=1 Tax=Pseudomonas sp. LRF_L74 TaxID=3369422 RepID=UPI003F624517